MDSMTKGMTPIVQAVSGWVKGFILVFGIYLVLYGHLTPGGGFGGGVVLAMAFVLLVLAFGKEEGLKPYTDATLKAWGAEGVKSVDVICPGFS